MEQEQFGFEVALVLLKEGKRITNGSGNVYFMESGNVYCIPRNFYPKGKRVEVRIYWDAILRNDWRLFEAN
jgi:hypothetical protein